MHQSLVLNFFKNLEKTAKDSLWDNEIYLDQKQYALQIPADKNGTLPSI